MAEVPEADNRLDAAIDILWDLFQGDTFAAWYELIIAGRTDPDLRPHVALVAGRLAETVRDTWNELFVLPRAHRPRSSTSSPPPRSSCSPCSTAWPWPA